MQVAKYTSLLPGRTVWVLRVLNDFSAQQTLLLSKVSEAVKPDEPGNHVGAGAPLDEFVAAQPGLRFVINGGFNHYRKHYYPWPHQDFNVGDPVGLVKIRQHLFQDILTPAHYGFFVQRVKGEPWAIVTADQVDRSSKYILGCTPLLIRTSKPIPLPREIMQPLPSGIVTSPSVLAHGLQHHARTAVGLKGDELVFLVVETGSWGGCTLPELQDVGVELELDSLLNLDGGGSSQFRVKTRDGWLRNEVAPQDENRILGNVIALFENRTQ